MTTVASVFREISEWLSLLEILAADRKERTAELAQEAAAPFFRVYINSHAERRQNIAAMFAEKLRTVRRECDVVSLCTLSACMPPVAFDDELFEVLGDLFRSQTELNKLWAFGRAAAARAIAVGGRREKNEADTRKRVNEAVHLLCMGTDDFTTDKRGDIGRFVREESMRGLSSLVESGLMTEPEIKEAVFRILQQSAEKIAKTRVCACECMRRILSFPGAQNALPAVELLGKVYSVPTDFQADSVLHRLALLLESEVLAPFLLRALIISAGGVSEGTTRIATSTLLEFVEQNDTGSKACEKVIGILSDMLQEKSPRIALSVLRLLPRLLSHIVALMEDADNNTALSRILAYLTKASNSAVPARCRLALESFSTLLGCPKEIKIWRIAAENCTRSLLSPMPSVRRAAAEGLAEGLCVAGVDDDVVLTILSETAWQDPEDATEMERAVQVVRKRLLEAGDL